MGPERPPLKAAHSDGRRNAERRGPWPPKAPVIGGEIAQKTCFVPFRRVGEPRAGRHLLFFGRARRPSPVPPLRRHQPPALPRPRRGRGTGGGRGGEAHGRKRQRKEDGPGQRELRRIGRSSNPPAEPPARQGAAGTPPDPGAAEGRTRLVGACPEGAQPTGGGAVGAPASAQERPPSGPGGPRAGDSGPRPRQGRGRGCPCGPPLTPARLTEGRAAGGGAGARAEAAAPAGRGRRLRPPDTPGRSTGRQALPGHQETHAARPWTPVPPQRRHQPPAPPRSVGAGTGGVGA